MKNQKKPILSLLEEMRPLLNFSDEMVEVLKWHSTFMLEHSRHEEGPIKAIIQEAAISSMRDIELEMAWRN